MLAEAHRVLGGLRAGSVLPPAEQEERLSGGSDDVGAALVGLVGSINLRSTYVARGSLLLHAGAVCRPDGAVLALCGPSGSGKTTLTARLVQDGLAYVTDETLCVDPSSLRVTPYRKPLAVKVGAQPVLPELAPDWTRARPAEPGTWVVDPRALGGPPLPDAVLSPALIVLPTYQAGSALHVQRLPPGEAAYLLGKESSSLRKVRGGPLPALARLARRAPAYRLVHSDVDAAADQVRALWDAA